jgi:hypothetical protein
MIHDGKAFDQITKLLSTIHDEHAVILIHVDAKSHELKLKMQSLIMNKYATAVRQNKMRVMEKSVNGLWGHSSLVSMQLMGFFELLEMNRDWKYVALLKDNYLMRQIRD